MKRSKFNEAQVAFILRQVDEGATVGEVCRKAGISEATFYVWRKKYAGLMPSEMKRLRQLKDDDLTPSLPPAGIRAGRLFCACARLKQWAVQR
ncbi:MAG: transposase, partial [Phenylobacterium sp.]|uniref:transposase n=1 Tax=Phenylobacterium sp. TaxID=1871053 RepID=UPI0018068390